MAHKLIVPTSREIICEVPMHETNAPEFGQIFYYMSSGSRTGVCQSKWKNDERNLRILTNKNVFLDTHKAATTFRKIFGVG